MFIPASLCSDWVDDMTWFLWTISTGTGGHYRPELVDDFTGLRTQVTIHTDRS